MLVRASYYYNVDSANKQHYYLSREQDHAIEVCSIVVR